MTRLPFVRSIFAGVLLLVCLAAGDVAHGQVRPNAALQFDGTGGRVEFVAPLTALLAKRFTVEMWIRPAGFSDTIGVFGGFVQDSSSRSGFGVVLSPGGHPGILWFSESGAAVALWSERSLRAGSWSHIAIERDAAALRLIVDGTLAVSDPAAGSLLDSSSTFSFGGLSGIDSAHFAGEIDEVRIWSRARSEQELRLSQHVRLQGRESGLVAYLAFDEGSGTAVTDEFTSLVLARLTGATTWIGSDVPVGTGRTARLDILEPGRRYFNGTDLLVDFLRNYRTNQVYVTSLLDDPHDVPDGLAHVTRRSWLMRSHIAGSFYATLTFYVGAGAIGAADAAAPSNLRLYRRRAHDSSAWTLAGPALRVDTAAGTVTFGPLQTGVDGFDGQCERFVVGTIGDSPLEIPRDIIVRNPLTATGACFGYPAAVAIAARGHNLVYQWSKDGIALPDATGPEIAFRAVDGTDSGNYEVTIVGQDGQVVRGTSAFLAVTIPPNVWGDPTDVRVLEGRRFFFNANFDGTNLQFQWQRNGVDIPGATSMILDFGPVDTSMAGYYRLLVWNECGRDSSVPARLVVERKPPVAAIGGDPLELELSVSPNPSNDRIVVDLGSIGRTSAGEVTVELIDERGRTLEAVRSTRVDDGNRLEINTSGVVAGAYFLRVTGVGGVGVARVLIRR